LWILPGPSLMAAWSVSMTFRHHRMAFCLAWLLMLRTTGFGISAPMNGTGQFQLVVLLHRKVFEVHDSKMRSPCTFCVASDGRTGARRI
jgi:hypothetical protein